VPVHGHRRRADGGDQRAAGLAGGAAAGRRVVRLAGAERVGRRGFGERRRASGEHPLDQTPPRLTPPADLDPLRSSWLRRITKVNFDPMTLTPSRRLDYRKTPRST